MIFIQVFKTLLRPSSLECSEVPLVYLQATFLISKRGIHHIFVKIIAPVPYLGSWVLVAPIIASTFLKDRYPFLLKAIGVNYWYSFSIPSPSKVNAWRFSSSNVCMHPSFWTIFKKGNRMSPRKCLKKNSHSSFSTSFLTCLLILIMLVLSLP